MARSSWNPVVCGRLGCRVMLHNRCDPSFLVGLFSQGEGVYSVNMWRVYMSCCCVVTGRSCWVNGNLVFICIR